jgi:hypothetical protein
MHTEVLTHEQEDLLPLLKTFSDKFGLVGGTAVALQIGHRESIDFDLFKIRPSPLDIMALRTRLTSFTEIEKVLIENPDEYTLIAGGVRFTFYNYPFGVEYSEKFKDAIRLPDLLSLAAMKAFALGKRAKWKDYVDLYFIFKDYSLRDVSEKSREIFDGEFNEKLFRQQLSYFEDIDYSEEVVYTEGFEVSDEIVRKYLQELSLR